MTHAIVRFNALPRIPRMLAAAICVVAGSLLAYAAGIPLPWLLGALAVSGGLSMSGVDLGISDNVRKIGQVVAGFSVGLFFTPAVGARALELGWIMVLTGCASILVSVVLSVFLAKAGACDRRSAFFAMMPGGLAEMAGFAHQFGANITLVSLSQSLRVITIVLTLPPILALTIGSGARDLPHHASLSLGPMLAGLAVAACIGAGLNRLRVFNPWLLGGLIVGIALGLALEEHLYAPPYARAFAQVAIGAALGARFQWSILRALGFRFLPATIISTMLLMAANGLSALAIISYLDFPTGVLATAPGGIAEMSLTAEALHLAPPLVTAWQLVRIILVALLTGPIFKIYNGLTK
ncbi:AbrB family transcriptional regulator [Aquabacter spiritensis]|uniref:AbrB family transcriptional regulator n=1 Tax=Aquabacter spiritensis TaxID=933073 RepID=UPI00140542EC|nr:AbrB family transcriptional regulator [Aquabacter spiritensis]